MSQANDLREGESLDALFERLEGQLVNESGIRSRARDLARPWARAVGLLAIFGLAGAWMGLRPRADLALYPRARLLAELAALALLAAGAAWTFTRPLSKPSSSRAWLRLVLIASGLVAATLVSAPFAHLAPHFLGAGTGPQLVPVALVCVATGCSVALPVLGVLLLLDRGGRSGLANALAPLAAWMAGLLALQSHCPYLAHEHQWAGHFALLGPVVVAWWLLRRRLVPTQ
jgi:hypothetical protein